jgi:hypothetical protein
MGNILLKVLICKVFLVVLLFHQEFIWKSSNLNFLEPRVPPSPSLGDNVDGAMFELLVLESGSFMRVPKTLTGFERLYLPRDGQKWHLFQRSRSNWTITNLSQ